MNGADEIVVSGYLSEKTDACLAGTQSYSISTSGHVNHAHTVRNIENKGFKNQQDVSYGFITNQFIWFANSAVNFTRFFALLDIMLQNGWTDVSLGEDKSQQKAVRKHCNAYVVEVIPEILHFRNKFAAHYASTDMRWDDNAASIANCWSIPVVNKNSMFLVGAYSWNINGEAAEVKAWSLTMEWERLCSRYPNWPSISLFSPPSSVRTSGD